MPIYEYACPDCGEVTEKLRKVSEREDPVSCSKCGGATKKKVSESSFQLKGGGWYKDGYSS